MLSSQRLAARSVRPCCGLRSVPRYRVRNSLAAKATVPDVVCVGEGLFDMLADDKGVPKEEVSSWSGYPGGAPCNVACGCGQLGIPVAFVSCLGNDAKGDELAQLMTERGVDISAVRRVEHPTRDVYVTRTDDGDRIFDSFGQDTNTYCDCFIDAEHLPTEVIAGAKVLVLGTLGLAYPTTAAAMHAAVATAKEAKTVVMVDLNWRPVFFDVPEDAKRPIVDFVKGADVVKITDEESEWAFGIPAAEALAEPARVAECLPEAQGVLVTGGGSGAAYAFKKEDGTVFTGSLPIYNVEVQDTTGAGDAFTCGFLSYLLREKEGKANKEGVQKLLHSPDVVQAAIAFAAACGALTTLNSGAIAAQPKLKEIESLVNARGIQEE